MDMRVFLVAVGLTVTVCYLSNLKQAVQHEKARRMPGHAGDQERN